MSKFKITFLLGRAEVPPQLLGWCCFPPPFPLLGGAALGGLALPSSFAVVLPFPPVVLSSRSSFWVTPLSSSSSGVVLFHLLLLRDGGAFFLLLLGGEALASRSFAVVLFPFLLSVVLFSRGAFSPLSFWG